MCTWVRSLQSQVAEMIAPKLDEAGLETALPVQDEQVRNRSDLVADAALNAIILPPTLLSE